MNLKYVQTISWKKLVSIGKGLVVVCAFLAFAISMREKELSRFSSIKPMFEILPSTSNEEFKLLNHGGIVYFAGCINDAKSKDLADTPRRYSAFVKGNELSFKYAKIPVEGSTLICYWRDSDLNTYKLSTKLVADGWYIDGVPLVYRSNQYVTMPRKWLDDLLDLIFPKEWFDKGQAPDDSVLIVK